MIGDIISGVAQLGSTIYGGIKSGQYNKKALGEISARERENQRWYDMKSTQDYTQRSDVQNILRKQKELFDERMKRARATNVVAGGTDESLALQQSEANKAVAETMAGIASNAASYKDSLENAYRAEKDALSKERQGVYARQAGAVAQAAGQVGSAAGSLGEGIDEIIKKRS